MSVSLRAQVFIGVVLAGFVPVGLLGAYTVRSILEALGEESQRITRIAAEAGAGELRVLLSEQLRLVRIADDQSTRTGDVNRTLDYYRGQAPQIQAAIVTDADGNAIAASPQTTTDGDSVLALNYKDRPFFTALMGVADVSITGRLNSRATGVPAVAVVIARRNSDGEFLGVIGCTIAAAF
ncbi:MAG: hypothetical protein AAFX94_24785, partial [Myxococcota bacterium]